MTEQASLFAPVYDTPRLRKWREDNPIVWDRMRRRFVALCQTCRHVSVRDLLGWARTEYAQAVDRKYDGYAFNNNLTTELSLHLCSKYPEYAHKVEHRGAASEIAAELKLGG